MAIKTWMIYGAAGYSGRLITEKALEKGLQPILAGRDSAPIKEMARDLGLEVRLFNLNDSVYMLEQLQGIDAVVSCAGPFSATARPMIEA